MGKQSKRKRKFIISKGTLCQAEWEINEQILTYLCFMLDDQILYYPFDKKYIHYNKHTPSNNLRIICCRNDLQKRYRSLTPSEKICIQSLLQL